MNSLPTKILFGCLVSVFFLAPNASLVSGAEIQKGEMPEVRFNNQNWFVLDQPNVHSFTVQNDGSAYGLTVNEIPFTLENISNTHGIKVQRFVMQDHYHYIVAGEAVFTTNELSKRLALLSVEQ